MKWVAPFILKVGYNMKVFWNSLGSILAKRRPKVSCDGMPLGSSRNCLNQSNFDCSALTGKELTDKEIEIIKKETIQF